MKKRIISVITFGLLFSLEMQAQITTSLNSFYATWIRPAIPIVGGLVFIVCAFVNIGKLFGESRDYKGFIQSLVLYLCVYFAIVGIVAMIMSSTA